jgi:hypothetical protein
MTATASATATRRLKVASFFFDANCHQSCRERCRARAFLLPVKLLIEPALACSTVLVQMLLFEPGEQIKPTETFGFPV